MVDNFIYIPYNFDICCIFGHLLLQPIRLSHDSCNHHTQSKQPQGSPSTDDLAVPLYYCKFTLFCVYICICTCVCARARVHVACLGRARWEERARDMMSMQSLGCQCCMLRCSGVRCMCCICTATCRLFVGPLMGCVNQCVYGTVPACVVSSCCCTACRLLWLCMDCMCGLLASWLPCFE